MIRMYKLNKIKKNARSLQRTFSQRGGRDSNPRSRYSPDNHLAGGPNQPLWHLPFCRVILYPNFQAYTTSRQHF